MPAIGREQLQAMRDAFDIRIARYLVKAALNERKITYGELAGQFGGIARSFGNRLGGITLWCHDRALPKLPVIVVNKQTGKPSLAAVLYKDLGLLNDRDITREQQKCFAYDWSSTELNS
jgi:hypothetical protein